MNEITLKQIMEEMCLEEANEFANMEKVPHNHFSIHHRSAMKKILSVNQPEWRGSRYLPPSKRIILVTMLIFLALFSVPAVATATKGFIRKEHRDNTELFAANAKGSPGMIEQKYYLPEIPEGYEMYQNVVTPFSVYISYKNPDSNNSIIVFCQDVKENYGAHFDNERASFEEVDINGHLGLYLDFGTELGEDGLLVWDNNDYILEISGNLSKNALINLAKSAKF